MPRLIVTEFLTLDGVMQAPGDPNEDRSGGFDNGGWQLEYFDDIFASAMMDGLAAAGGFLLGRKTYENFAAHWPKQPAEDPLAATFNDLPKYVVSATLTEPLAWQNSTLLRGDVPAQIAALKSGSGKEIQLIGSGELVQTLIGHDLIDEYRLLIHPLLLGNGKRLFRETIAPTKLRLVESKATGKGVLIATYAPENGADA
jgi:dihydrofolate reductase